MGDNFRIYSFKRYNLHLYDDVLTSGVYDIPTIRKEEGLHATKLIGFNYAMTSEDKKCGIHCFLDDYQIERLWNTPERYLNILKKYECVLTPDYSLYMDMPMAMKIWNTYRSRLIGQYWQKEGIKVIPTISWAEKETYKFCFDGVEEGSIVAISTVGVHKESNSLKLWKNGVDEMIKRINPLKIIIYGDRINYEYLNGRNIEYYSNDVVQKVREYGRKRS